MPSSPTTTAASTNDPPFYLDPAVGDLVIRSSDGIDFHVHKDTLTRASPFFATTLSPPHPASTRSVEVVCGKPLIEAQEDSAVWTHVIPVCYVPRPPEPALDASQLDLIRAILHAARKYNIASVTECMRGVLKSPAIVTVKPVGVYAVACVYGLEDVARVAARRSLSEPVCVDYVEELDLISIRTFHKLSAYRTRCIAAALRVMEPRGIWETQYGSSLRTPSGCNCRGTGHVVRGHYSIRRSWGTYMEGLERLLEKTPDALKARDPSLVEPVISSVHCMNCTSCLKTIHDNVEMVSTGLEMMLKKAIDQVVLEF
ncbi:hypothetical protein LXA43DRAFT_1095783 [Ganoderma leucocontextum]|nr:hypothetical protein LXA43DRAFT_1095783 [Ganoderma leucocontextum]